MLTAIIFRLQSIFVPAVLALLLCPIALPVHGSGQPDHVENFRLFDHEGKAHELRRYADRKAVVLFVAGNGCPIVRQTLPVLKELREVYGDEGVAFLLINANPQDDRPAIAGEAEAFSISFPILIDRAQLIARSLGIERTGEAILINAANGEILYRGAVDDSLDYGTVRPAANFYLEDAIDAFLAGEEPATPRTDPRGCLIHIDPLPEELTYVEHIAPIIQSRCLKCHSAGNIAPFPFTRYEVVRGWAPMMREVIRTKRMPPWHADAHYSSFSNDRSLSIEEKQALISWIESGAPRGEGEDPLLENSVVPAVQWELGEPDHVVSLPEEVTLPATGLIDYKYFRVPADLDADAWIKAIDIRPGNREVVHHALIFVEYPQELSHLQPDFRGGLEGFFAGYVPGTEAEFFPEGTGKFVPKGSHFIFQMHYTATGRPETDLTEMAFYFFDEKPPYKLHTKGAYNTRLNIPPGAADYEVEAIHEFSGDVILYGMSPHMHFRGNRFEYKALYPDGSTEILLSVPYYDFNWQTTYMLEEPKRLPAGTKLLCRGAFDNSAMNPANPDPEQTVRFGEQTSDEMFIGYFLYRDDNREGPEDLATNR